MILTRTTTLLLLCSIAFVAAPASAAPDARTELSARVQAPSVEFTDMSARRRHHRVARHEARRGHYRHTRARYGRGAGSRSAAMAVRQPVTAFDSYASVGGTPDVGAVQSHDLGALASAARGQSFGGTGVVAEARRYIGGNPTRRSRLWCAEFLNLVLTRSGHQGSGSGFARSFASYGTRVAGPQVGAIAVMSRGRRGGHVGVVSGIDASGNPIVISGNHGGRVAESVYPRGRIYAYVMP
jgi:uncharacterized protein (TIGR02594 family)